MGGDHSRHWQGNVPQQLQENGQNRRRRKTDHSGRGTGPPNIRQVNDPGSLSKPEKLGSMNGIGAAGLRRAVLAVCAVYSGPDTFGGALHPVVRSRSLELEFPVGKPTPVSRSCLEQVLSGRSETDI